MTVHLLPISVAKCVCVYVRTCKAVREGWAEREREMDGCHLDDEYPTCAETQHLPGAVCWKITAGHKNVE